MGPPGGAGAVERLAAGAELDAEVRGACGVLTRGTNWGTGAVKENEDSLVEEAATSESVAVATAGSPLCLTCLTPNEPAASFCTKCGAPIGTYSTTDPMLLIQSQGAAYRNAATGRVSVFGLVGMWAIFAPQIPILIGTGVQIWVHGVGGTGFALLLTLLLAALVSLYAAVLHRATRNYVRYRRYRAGMCGICRYSLRGLPTARCPECGVEIPEEYLDDAPADTATPAD